MRVIGELLAAVALIQVEPGLVSGGNIECQLPAMLAQHQLDRASAAQPAADQWQALALTAAGVGTLIKPGKTGSRQQGINQHLFPALGSRRQKLRHQGVAITVHDQTRQAVGLTVHQTQRVALDVKARSGTDRPGASQVEEGCVNALCLVKAPGPRPDLGDRAERRPGKKLAFMRLDPHGLAGVGRTAGDGRFKDPGVPAQQRALLAGS